MSARIALLRGVNVGGRAQVAMADLRRLLADLGFVGARTLLQSGNLLFEGGDAPGAELEGLLEAEVERRLGLGTAFFVRDALEWRAVVDRNPLPTEAARDPSHLVVAFLKEAVREDAVEALAAGLGGPEVIRPGDRQLYVHYPAGIGRSRLTNALMESKLGTRVTGRNWNTVLRLAELAGA
jgi:uncharacterized protein (DUF1697 family)